MKADTIEAGPELDARVAVEVMGWPVIDYCEPYRHHIDKGGVVVEGGRPQKFRGYGIIPDDWYPSMPGGSGHALDVVSRLVALGRRVNIHIHPDEGVTVQVVPLDPKTPCPKPGKADALPLAVCRAALLWAEARA